MEHKLLLSVALTSIVTTSGGYAADVSALPKEQVKQLCSLATELAAYPALYISDLVGHVSAEQKMQRTKLKFRIYTAKRSAEEAKLMLPIMVACTNKCKDSLSSLMTTIKPGLKAIDASAYLSGRIMESLEFLADLHEDGGSGSSAGCLSASNSKVIEGKANLPGCPKRNRGIDGVPKQPSVHLTANGFVKLPTTVSTTNQRAAANAKCDILGTQSGKSGLNSAQVTDGATLLAGYLHLGKNSQTYGVTDLNNLQAAGKTAQAPHFQTAYEKHKAYTPISKATCDVAEFSVADIVEDETATQLFAELLMNKTGKATEQEKQRVKEKIEQTYKKGNDFQKHWVEKATKNKVPKEAAGEEGSGQIELENEHDIDKLRRILNYYSAQTIKRELMAAATGTGSNPACTSNREAGKKTPTKEDCKEHTDKEPCQEAGCKFDGNKKDGEKCFPDPEPKTEKKDGGDDGKQAQLQLAQGNPKSNANLRIVSGKVKLAKILVFLSIKNWL
uniref:Variant surface glycoprotein 1125.1034 n=1 Tax=Trypanosoma brucei TaxID=5691 RepID=A0A1J0R4D3_9TRYP|nr:variant surface glycoprotein 1125.1034 [Trypanosoma brucei]